MDIAGKKAKVEGKVIQKMVSVNEQKHYLKDEKAPQAEIDKIKEPKATYRFVAHGVELL